MTLIKKNNGVFTTFPSLFEDFFHDNFYKASKPNKWFDRAQSMPAVNVKESDAAFLVEVAAPGLKKEDFKIELDNNMLTVACEKQQDQAAKAEDGKYTRREFSFVSFKRSFTLPEDMVNVEQIEAKYVDGILQLTLPKRPKQEVYPKRVINIG